MMHARMACNAERNQVLFGIVTGVAAKLSVVDLQVQHRAARLTLPAITAEHSVAELFVQIGIQPQARRFWANRAHDAFSLRPPRNACPCSPGRNLKNLVIEYSSISGSPLSAQASKKYREGFMSLIGPKPAHTGSSRKRRMRVCGSKSCVALWPAGHSR